jgi:tripartite-type tricarboxylate transporter receptor subunit TctC
MFRTKALRRRCRIMAGHVHMMFATAASVIGLINSNKVRALAVTAPKRTALLSELPTVDELGIKGFDATTWHGLVAPAGTPKDIIDTLNFATVAALKDPRRKGADRPRRRYWRDSPKEFEAYIKTEIRSGPVVKQSGTRID